MLEQDEDLNGSIDGSDNSDDEQDDGDSQSKHFEHKPVNCTIRNLKQAYDDKRLNLNPDFQRHFVWDIKLSSKLIESVLMNVPIPSIFISVKNNRTKDVIDGQQRLTSLFRYVNNQFKLTGLSNKKLNNKSFDDLLPNEKEDILEYTLLVIEISENKNPNAMYDMFERLNKGSVKLNSQEIRNSVYRGEYNNFIKELAKNNTFRKTVGGNEEFQVKHMFYEELVLLFFTVIEIFPQSKFGIKAYQLNGQMALNKSYGAERKEKDKNIFENTFSLIYEIFGETAFAPFEIKEDGNKKEITKKEAVGSIRVNRGLYVAMVYVFSRQKYSKNIFRQKKDVILEAIKSLMIDDGDFKNTISVGTMDAKSVSQRVSILDDTINNIMGKEEETPRAFTYEFKKSLFSRNPVCAICKQKINDIEQAEVDHILAWVNGGKTVPENAQLAHYYCNRQKSSR